MEWQPIERAPKDGTAVWLWCGGQAYIGQYEPPIWFSVDDDNNGSWFLKAMVLPPHRKGRPEQILGTYVSDASPTLWQPLPEPPKEHP